MSEPSNNYENQRIRHLNEGGAQGSVPETTPAPTPSKVEKRSLKRPIGIGVGIIGTAAVAVLAANMFLPGNDSGTKPPQATESSAPADPSDPSDGGSDTPEKEYTVEALSINAELINDPEKLIQSYTERMNDWMNAGATPENAQIVREAGFDIDKAHEIAASYDQVFIEALFGPNWQTDPGVADLVAKAIDAHAATFTIYCNTSFPNITPEDKKPYVRTTIVDSLDSSSPNTDGSVTIVNSEHDVDNKDDNSVGEIGPATGASGEVVTPTRQFSNIDGSAKLTAIIFG